MIWISLDSFVRIGTFQWVMTACSEFLFLHPRPRSMRPWRDAADSTISPWACQARIPPLLLFGTDIEHRVEICKRLSIGAGVRISACVQVFGRRQHRDFPHAQPAGVQKASRHEVAGRLAPAGRRALWRFDARAGSMVDAAMGQGDLHACRQERAREREKRLSWRLKGMSGRRAHGLP